MVQNEAGTESTEPIPDKETLEITQTESAPIQPEPSTPETEQSEYPHKAWEETRFTGNYFGDELIERDPLTGLVTKIGGHRVNRDHFGDRAVSIGEGKDERKIRRDFLDKAITHIGSTKVKGVIAGLDKPEKKKEIVQEDLPTEEI